MITKNRLMALALSALLAMPALLDTPALAQENESAAPVEPVRPQLATPETTEGGSDPSKPHEQKFEQPDDVAGASIPHLTTNDFLQKVGSAELPVLIQFDAKWCPFCRKMQPYLDKLRNNTMGRIEVYKVDADADPDLMRAYEVGTLPTMIFFHNGSIVGRSDGGLSEQELKDWVNEIEADVKKAQRRGGGGSRPL